MSPQGKTDWKKAMKEAVENAKNAKNPEAAEAWNAVRGYIARATGLEKGSCPCGRSLITPDYCPFFGDHK